MAQAALKRDMLTSPISRWIGQPSGRSCPACPDVFGSCNISIYQDVHCSGAVIIQMRHANLVFKGPEWSPGIMAGKNGEEGRSVRVECEEDWQS